MDFRSNGTILRERRKWKQIHRRHRLSLRESRLKDRAAGPLASRQACSIEHVQRLGGTFLLKFFLENIKAIKVLFALL